MASLVSTSLASDAAEFSRLRNASRLALLSPEELVHSGVIIVEPASSATAAFVAAPLPPVATVPTPAATESPKHGGDGGGDDAVLNESERAELRRLEATIRDVMETDERVMAQNIALLADLEVAQRAVRELRADKDAMAVQLKRALVAGGE